MQKFSKDQKVKCVDIKPLKGNDIAPPLELNKIYSIKDITLDRDGNQHLDVGLASVHNYVRSYETKEELPQGHKIHWCHPSRFMLVS